MTHPLAGHAPAIQTSFPSILSRIWNLGLQLRGQPQQENHGGAPGALVRTPQDTGKLHLVREAELAWLDDAMDQGPPGTDGSTPLTPMGIASPGVLIQGSAYKRKIK